jgi:hypothetical protein
MDVFLTRNPARNSGPLCVVGDAAVLDAAFQHGEHVTITRSGNPDFVGEQVRLGYTRQEWANDSVTVTTVGRIADTDDGRVAYAIDYRHLDRAPNLAAAHQRAENRRLLDAVAVEERARAEEKRLEGDL